MSNGATTPTCDFYCAKILKGLLDVPVCFENDQVFAFAARSYVPIDATSPIP